MKTTFEVDATSLTIQESHKLLDTIDTTIGEIIEHMGFQYSLRASGTTPVISYVVEDKS